MKIKFERGYVFEVLVKFFVNMQYGPLVIILRLMFCSQVELNWQ